MHSIRATARYNRAIHATAELLGKLRIDAMFVGNVARAAWLGGEITGGAVDVLALMNAPQKNQLAMMASNRGFRVDRDELEQTEELDLVPLNFVDVGRGFSPPPHVEGGLMEGGLKPRPTFDPEEEVRVHVLLASNALYGRMVAAGAQAVIDDRELRVPRAEDLALLLLFAEDEATVKSLAVLPEFDRAAFQERLVSIGLGGWAGME